MKRVTFDRSAIPAIFGIAFGAVLLLATFGPWPAIIWVGGGFVGSIRAHGL